MQMCLRSEGGENDTVCPFVSKKKGPSAPFRRLSGRCSVVDSQADRSLCAQQLKLLPNKKIN